MSIGEPTMFGKHYRRIIIPALAAVLSLAATLVPLGDARAGPIVNGTTNCSITLTVL